MMMLTKPDASAPTETPIGAFVVAHAASAMGKSYEELSAEYLAVERSIVREKLLNGWMANPLGQPFRPR